VPGITVPKLCEKTISQITPDCNIAHCGLSTHRSRRRTTSRTKYRFNPINIGGDAGNRNPRKPSPTILSGFKQSDRHLNSASNVSSVPQFSDERSQGRTKSVPNFGEVYLAQTLPVACKPSHTSIGNRWFKGGGINYSRRRQE